MIGSIISHYKILDKIGGGGAGIVYKAEDISLNRTVALKFLPRGTVESIERKKLFIREAQAAASLDHPNICTIHGIEEVGDQLFIVMAYIEGDTLQKVIDKQIFKIEDVVSIGLQIAEGLKVHPFLFAILYKELGQTDKMFHYLNKAVSEFDYNVIDLSQHPFFLEYHSDNRFKDILKKMNLM